MLRMLLIPILISIVSGVQAQETAIFDPSSEPEATTLLTTFEQFIRDHPNLHARFALEISIPGEQLQKMNGTLDQSEDKYHLEMSGYSIVSNGIIRWVYDSTNNEVNLYSAVSSSGPTTPLDYLSLYKEENFTYRLADDYAEHGEHCIEFKPTERYSDYSKFRITFDAEQTTPKRIEIFEKGGIRTDMQVNELRIVQEFQDGRFEFDSSRYPDIHIEDLRID